MEENSILSDRAKRAADKVKGYFTRRSVGGQVKEENYQLWTDYKQRCLEYNIQMNPDGMEHMLRLTNKIDKVFFPIANASGLKIMQFTEERIDKLLEAIKDNKDWINETDRLHDNIISDTDKNLIVQVKKK